jgi:hypothetical protein
MQRLLLLCPPFRLAPPGSLNQRTMVRLVSLIAVMSAATGQLPADPYNLDNPNLSPEERSRIIDSQKDMWGLQEESGPPAATTSHTSGPFLKLLHVHTASFDPDRFQRLQFDSLILEIPAGTFTGTEVEVRARVLDSPVDFILAGIPLQLEGSDGPTLLQSEGMFHLEFYSNRRRVEPARPLTAKMLHPSGLDDVRMYKLGSSWREVAPETERGEQWPDGCDARGDARDSVEKDGASLQAGPWTAEGKLPLLHVENPANPSNPCMGEFPMAQIYDRIDSSGWWNFDKPTKEMTCFAGTYTLPEKGLTLTIAAAGMDYQGLANGIDYQNGRFAVNAVRSSDVKIYAILGSLEKKKLYLASLPVLRSSDDIGFATLESRAGCKPAGDLSFTRIKPDVLTDRGALLKALDIVEL